MPHRPANPARLRPFRCKCGEMVDVSWVNEAVELLESRGIGCTVLANVKCPVGHEHAAELRSEGNTIQI